MVIGITGGSGTGKSLCAKAFGYKVIDCDEVYHELMASSSDMQNELFAEFGTLERSEIAAIVFNSKERLQTLNSITHKYVYEEVKRRLRGDVVIDAPLLFEAGVNDLCDITVALLANRDIRLSRIMSRDRLDYEDAERRINSQPTDEFYIKSADFIMTNNSSTIEELEIAIKPKVENLKHKFKRKVAVYGGTFDPPTLGHLDVIRRAAELYDKLYVVVLVNDAKKPLFTMDERLDMLRRITEDLPNVAVEQYNGMLTAYAVDKGAHFSVRGLRNGVDLEYERPMFEFNSQIAQDEYDGYALETIFIPTTRRNFDTSSSNVRALLAGGMYKTAARYLDVRIFEQVASRYKNKASEIKTEIRK
ncbi:hypothetical protein FACS189425_01630 [Clostridia bacterium]|nr:hypothetical protein FACS189425_01630 [Clostridia bacterium]